MFSEKKLSGYVPGDRSKVHYVAWRDQYKFLASQGACGGIPVNQDDRLWNLEGSPFVLTICEGGAKADYAVKDEDVKEIMNAILAWCSEHEDADPRYFDAWSLNPRASKGSNIVSVVEVDGVTVPFQAPELLRKWFDELREKGGKPFSPSELHAYTHPAPKLPEETLNVTRIVEQAVVAPRPISIPAPPPSNYRSEMIIRKDYAVLSVYSCEMHLEYVMPQRLVAKVNEEAKKMLSHPVNGFHTEGQADAWLHLDGKKQEYDVEPKEAVALFESLVPECGDPIPCHENYSTYSLYPEGVMKKLADAWTCPHCQTTRNTGKFCRTCGAPIQSEGAGNPHTGILSEPKPRAEAPWHCHKCHTDGNSGGYCEICGAPYPGGANPDAGKKIGYLPTGLFGLGMGMMGLMMEQNAMQSQPKPEKPAELKPGEWRCSCGAVNSGKFCTDCGTQRQAT